MPSEYNVSAYFNVFDLSSFDADDDFSINPLQEEENDEIEDKSVTGTWDKAYLVHIQVSIRPVIRARAKKNSKNALNGLIQASWTQSNSWRPIEGIAHDSQTTKCLTQALEFSE